MGEYGAYYAEKKKRKVKDTFSNKLKRVITSSLVFVGCYVAIIFLYQQLMVFLFKSYGYAPIANYNQIFNLPTDYTAWTRRTVTIIFTSAPLILLGIGIVSILLIRYAHHLHETVRFILLWLGIICFNLFISFLLAAPAGEISYDTGLYSAFAVVFAWWHLHVSVLVIIMVVFIMTSILTGYLLGFEFLKFSHSQSLLESRTGRNFFLTQVFLIPVLISTIPLIYLTNRYSFFLHIVFIANFFFLAIGMYIRNEVDKRGAVTTRKDILNKIPFIEGAIAVGIWLLIFLFYR